MTDLVTTAPRSSSAKATHALFPCLAERVQMLREADAGCADLSPIDYELIELWGTVQPYFAETVDPHGGSRADLILAYRTAR